MATFSWELLNKPRDLSDVFMTMIAQRPMFISRFAARPAATNRKHEWLEGTLRPRTISYSAYTKATGVFAVASSAGWNVGDRVRVKGDSAIFEITAVAANSITVKFVASNGSATDAIGDIATDASTLYFHNHPIAENSTSGQAMFSQSTTDYNRTQIFRGDVSISNTALAVATYGNENDISLQVKRALLEISREVNDTALFGERSADASASVAGNAGGLYFFGTQLGSLSVAASNDAISLKLLNDAAQNILDAGGTPDMILCGPGQARVISQLMRNQINITPGDSARGSYVNKVVMESTGQIADVVVEPALAAMDSDIWVLDSSGLGIVQLGSRQIHSEDATTPGLDGRKFSIIGEITFEFKNAKQKICRISGVQASATSLT
ncbi:MAG: DUF5309 family protein [Planctomycetia bacterium]|nr:DUF5309 family protein [Planctomycetia bacterium]